MTGRYMARALWGAVLWVLGGSFAFAAQQSFILPKGTTVQKLAPGQFRFRLPDGRSVEVHRYDPRTGSLSDCAVLDPSGRKQVGGTQCLLRKGIGPSSVVAPPGRSGGSLPPSPDYVRIDDEVTWLPSTLVIQNAVAGTSKPGSPGGAVMINPQPEPPGGRVTINPQPEPPRPAKSLK
jgi:hypothetical protein